METANFECLGCDIYENVYEPSEDTFLLIDALEKDFEIIKRLRPDVCLEVGSGSGVVIATIAKELQQYSTLCLSTDINPRAASTTKKIGCYNGISIQVVITDLAKAFESRLHKAVDLLIFNPPYVVTPTEEVAGNDISASWAGGVKGREVMDRFFPIVPNLLTAKGLFYLVVIKENDQDDIAHLMGTYGLKMKVVLSRRCGAEHLYVLRFSFESYS